MTKQRQRKKRPNRKPPVARVHEPGCTVCRQELGALEKPHLSDVFAATPTGGDLRKTLFEDPADLTEPGGRISYRNDNVFRCRECQGLWLRQYWEVDTPDRAFEEFGYRHWRSTPLSERQLSVIRSALKAGRKLSHNRFVPPTAGGR